MYFLLNLKIGLLNAQNQIQNAFLHAMYLSGLYISDLDTHEALLQIQQSSNAPNSIGSTGIYFFP